MRQCRSTLALLGLGLTVSGPVPAADFGELMQKQLETGTARLFGFTKPVTASATTPSGFARSPDQPASAQIALAQGLQVRYLTRTAAQNTDQMAFWPTDNAPTHLITCVEEFERQVIGQFPNGTEKYNPSVQRIRLADGKVETVLRGMEGCDGIRATPWGSVVATEETDDGGVYEILNPLATGNFTVQDRATGAIVNTAGAPDTAQIAKRAALPTIAWEGLELLPSGVVIGGDELRPGTPADADGGSMFKFVPAVPHAGGAIASLAESPLVAGDRKSVV